MGKERVHAFPNGISPKVNNNAAEVRTHWLWSRSPALETLLHEDSAFEYAIPSRTFRPFYKLYTHIYTIKDLNGISSKLWLCPYYSMDAPYGHS